MDERDKNGNEMKQAIVATQEEHERIVNGLKKTITGLEQKVKVSCII